MGSTMQRTDVTLVTVTWATPQLKRVTRVLVSATVLLGSPSSTLDSQSRLTLTNFTVSPH